MTPTVSYTLTALSAGIFFSFVVFCVCKFGLLDCYSAYGKKWGALSPVKGFNLWSAVTLLVAVLLIPPILEAAKDNPWQFLGFLCPASICFVALTPSYGRGKMEGLIHVVCASLGAIWAVLYVLLCATHLWWLILAYCALAGVLTLIFGKWSWNFWFEMAAFAVTYTAVFIMI